MLLLESGVIFLINIFPETFKFLFIHFSLILEEIFFLRLYLRLHGFQLQIHFFPMHQVNMKFLFGKDLLGSFMNGS